MKCILKRNFNRKNFGRPHSDLMSINIWLADLFCHADQTEAGGEVGERLLARRLWPSRRLRPGRPSSATLPRWRASSSARATFSLNEIISDICCRKPFSDAGGRSELVGFRRFALMF
jgi:hypothetical protein